jgi:hypothetical protein
VLDLHSFDMIIGMDWLGMFSTMKIQWAQKWLSIPYGKGHITLQGILPETATCSLIEFMQIATDYETKPSLAIPASIQLILD